MQNEIQLSLPTPCSEDWQAMDIRGPRQRYCTACERTLTDFTTLTDAELVQFFAGQQGPLCGRFRADQLERPLYAQRPHAGWWRRVAALTGLTLAAGSLGAQPTPTPPTTEQSDTGTSSAQFQSPIMVGRPAQRANSSPSTTARLIEGTVLDEQDGEPLAGAVVLIMGTKCGTVTDFDGHYQLKVPPGDDIRLQFSYTGFTTREVAVGALSGPVLLSVSYPIGELIGVLGISRPRRRTVGQWVARLWRRMLAHTAGLAAPPHDEVLPSDEVAELPSNPPATLTYLQRAQLSPNPAAAQVVSVRLAVSDQRPIVVQLFNANGQTLWTHRWATVTGNNELAIPTDQLQLTAGTYFLFLTDEEGEQYSLPLVWQ